MYWLTQQIINGSNQDSVKSGLFSVITSDHSFLNHMRPWVRNGGKGHIEGHLAKLDHFINKK